MHKWFKTALVAAVFLFVMFIALELSLRVYLFGPTGFSPSKVGSFSLIFSSGLVQASENPEIWYELKPNQNTLFRGVPFRTNSQGLADDEYSFEKPPNTIRVAVVGSSWTMGSAAELADAYHAVLERQFNSAGGSKRYEFINFGVEFYGLQEIVATVRDKVLRYDPDLILVEVTASTPNVRWTTHETEFIPLPRRNKAWDSMLLARVTGALGLASEEVDEAGLYRDLETGWDWDPYFGRIERAFDELAEISKASGIPVAVALLRIKVRNDDFMGQRFVSSAAERGMAGADVNLDKFLQPGETYLKFLVSRVEPHPNAYGHELIAGELRRQIFDTNPLFQIPLEQ
jgi:hypothetical protein